MIPIDNRIQDYLNTHAHRANAEGRSYARVPRAEAWHKAHALYRDHWQRYAAGQGEATALADFGPQAAYVAEMVGDFMRGWESAQHTA